MRPKKVVLLIDSNETSQSTMRFLLEVKGYRVLSATTGEEALEFAAAESISVMLLRDRGRSPKLSALALSLKESNEAPLMFISQHKESRADDPCYNFIQWERATPTELLAQVKIFAARKSGPPKKPVQAVWRDPFMDYIRGRA